MSLCQLHYDMVNMLTNLPMLVAHAMTNAAAGIAVAAADQQALLAKVHQGAHSARPGSDLLPGSCQWLMAGWLIRQQLEAAARKSAAAGI
jgi:hypothetical protein